MTHRFQVCDLNAVETRVGAYLAECSSLLNVFQPYTDPMGKYHRNGKDPYLSFAAKMYSMPYDILWANKEGLNGKEAKNDTKRKRQVAKVPVLAAIYRMGGGGWGNGKASYIDEATGEKVYDRVRTGLLGYAHSMNVQMTQQEAHSAVEVFRNAYPEICGNGYDGNMKGIWVRLEDAVLDVMDSKHPATVRYIGPNNAVKIDRLNVSGRQPLMRMTLPSGRKLHYLDAEISNTLMPWTDKEGGPVYRPALWYAHEDQTTGVWGSTHTHGGKLFENLVQGLARDVLACKLLQFEENDLPCVGHIHDEGICLVPDDPFSQDVEHMVDIMSEEIPWAKGLLLGADGFTDSFYHK
jgi:DNA polymerase bacteriophage-type